MGDTALRYWQIVTEAVWGTGLAATRKIHGTGTLGKVIGNFSPDEDRNSYDARFAHAPQLIAADGAFTQPLYVEELPEWLLGAINGGTTPTQINPKVLFFDASGGNPTAVQYYQAAPQTYTSYLTETTGAGSMSLAGMGTTDYVYIGAGQHFDDITVTLTAAVNGTASVMTLTYWNGTAWTAVAGFTDGTALAGATFGQTGTVLFTAPGSAWKKRGINGIEAYWVRIAVSVALDSSVAVDTLLLLNLYIDYTTQAVGAGDVPMSSMQTTDFLYLGYSIPWNIATVTMAATVNGTVSALAATYWNGAWGAVAGLTDGTSADPPAGGATFGKTGVISWTMPADAVAYSVSGESLYWVRLAVSVALDTTTDITTIAFTPAAASAYRWTFTPDTTTDTHDSHTIEYNDGTESWELNGTCVDTLELKGGVSAEAAVSLTFLAEDKVIAAMTGALGDTTPAPIQGWESKFYVDAFGNMPGGTEVTATLLDWTITISHNKTKHYSSANTQLPDRIDRGKRTVDASFTVDFNASAQAIYTDLLAGTDKIVRLELGNNTRIGGSTSAVKELVQIDLPGRWIGFVVGEGDNTTTVQLEYQNKYDSTNGYSHRATVQNSRSAAA